MRRNWIILAAAAAILFIFLGKWFQANPIRRAPAGQVTGAPNPLDFKKVLVGGTAKLDLTWSNGMPHDLTIVTAGTNGAPFGAQAAGGVMAKNGGTAVVKYTFSPVDKGVFNGRANIITQGGAAQIVRPEMTGEGIYSANSGIFTVSVPVAAGGAPPEFVDFGQVTVGASSPAKAVAVSNGSGQNINGNAGTNSPVFTAATANPIILPANGNSIVNVTFTPSERKVYWGILLVQDISNPGNANYTIIVLKGEGVGGG